MTNAMNAPEVDAVKAAVLDYIEGIYGANPSRMKPSLHPELAKVGFMSDESGYSAYPMTYEQVLEATATFNLDGKIPQDAIKDITIFEVLDQTASVKLEAWWGVDYIHLAKYDGKWMIIQVLWQTHPKSGN